MHKNLPQSLLLDSCAPEVYPGLVAFWRFSHAGETFKTEQGEDYQLRSQSGPLRHIEDDTAPLGRGALRVDHGQWLNVPRSECPLLDIHGSKGRLTVVAWIKRDPVVREQCEFIAGQWNETNLGRQYGLFLNIRVWGSRDQICGHLSHVGGATPGYKYCIDGAMGATPVPRDEWVVVAMSYDGIQGYAWLNGLLDFRPGLNPYSLSGGLYDGGPQGSDFTVGAVDRSGEIGNFFCGWIAGLAVYNRALTPAEIFALSRL